MNSRRKQQMIWYVIIIMLGLAVWWTYAFAADSRQAAVYAAQDAEQCRDIAEQIKAIKATPQMASAHELEGTALLQRIDQAAGQTGMPSPKKFTPQLATRVSNNSPYKEKPALVEWEGVTIKQLTTMLHTLTTRETGLRVKSIDIRASKIPNSNVWDVTATLAQLVYDPIKMTNSGKSNR